MAHTQAVIFDLDGTLTDSAPGIIASYRHTLEHFGMSATDEAIRACIGPPLGVSLARLGIPAARQEEAIAVYRDYFGATGIADQSPYPGIPELLQRLHAGGVTLALATSKREDFAPRILELIGVAGLFTAVAGAGVDGTRVEKTDIARWALAQLPPDTEPVVVGDRRDDILAARAIGAAAVAVTWGYGDRAELEQAGATRFAGNPTELLGHLRTFWGRAEL